MVHLVLLGVGALRSPRYPPAGLLICSGRHRVMVDGGGAETFDRPIEQWLVCDEQAEEMPAIRARCRTWGLRPHCGPWQIEGLRVQPQPVRHTSHPTFGYLLRTDRSHAVWAPEFWTFPDWATGARLMFADAAGWSRPIRFAGGAGGHASVVDTAMRAQKAGVEHLVFAHIGRPSIRARDAGLPLPYGSWGDPGMIFDLP